MLSDFFTEIKSKNQGETQVSRTIFLNIQKFMKKLPDLQTISKKQIFIKKRPKNSKQILGRLRKHRPTGSQGRDRVETAGSSGGCRKPKGPMSGTRQRLSSGEKESFWVKGKKTTENKQKNFIQTIGSFVYVLSTSFSVLLKLFSLFLPLFFKTKRFRSTRPPPWPRSTRRTSEAKRRGRPGAWVCLCWGLPQKKVLP